MHVDSAHSIFHDDTMFISVFEFDLSVYIRLTASFTFEIKSNYQIGKSVRTLPSQPCFRLYEFSFPYHLNIFLENVIFFFIKNSSEIRTTVNCQRKGRKLFICGVQTNVVKWGERVLRCSTVRLVRSLNSLILIIFPQKNDYNYFYNFVDEILLWSFHFMAIAYLSKHKFFSLISSFLKWILCVFVFKMKKLCFRICVFLKLIF